MDWDFIARPEVKKLLDYLRVISDPNSDAGDEALIAILNVPVRYISRKVITQLEEEAASKGVHLYEALKAFRADTPFIRKNIKELVSFLEPIDPACPYPASSGGDQSIEKQFGL